MALHEAGHVIVARHFGLDAHAVAWENPDGSDVEKFVLGRTYYQPTTPFRECCIAYAGTIAEGIDDMFSPGQPWAVFDDILEAEGRDDYSSTDSAGFRAHPQNWRACKTAHRILTTRVCELIDYAREVVRNSGLGGKARGVVWPSLPQSRK